MSVVSGIVAYAGFDPIGGNNVLIRGDDGLQYYYAHLDSTPLVKTGSRVGEGDKIGAVGNTGNASSTGPHLHIGIGKSIITGSGPQGGAGSGFDAVGYLRGLLGGSIPSKIFTTDDGSPGISGKATGSATITSGSTISDPRDATGKASTSSKPYTGNLIDVQTNSIGIPTGIKFNDEWKASVKNYITDRIIPFLIGLVIAYVGALMIAGPGAVNVALLAGSDGESAAGPSLPDTGEGTKLLGFELIIVGLSLMWFAVHDTVKVAEEAITKK